MARKRRNACKMRADQSLTAGSAVRALMRGLRLGTETMKWLLPQNKP